MSVTIKASRGMFHQDFRGGACKQSVFSLLERAGLLL